MAPNRVVLSTLLVAAMAIPIGAAVTPVAPEGQKSSHPGGTVSVGQFLIELARALDPALPDAVTIETAVAVLTSAGLDVEAEIDVQRALTEKDIVLFTSGVGLTVTTLHPDHLFPAAKLDALRVMLNARLSVSNDAIAQQSSGNSGDNNAGGSARAREKRKKKKVFESPHIPPGQGGGH